MNLRLIISVHKVLFLDISLILFPTFISGCSESVLSSNVPSFMDTSLLINEFRSSQSSINEGSTLDILVFDDDKLKRLDSYQRYENFSGPALYTTSTGGNKIIFLLYGSESDRYRWAEINSYSSLSKIYCNLEDENRESAVMTGHCRCAAGSSSIPLLLAPLSGIVNIRSLRCDFSGTEYSGSEMTQVKAYLTNVNAVSGIVPKKNQGPVRLINAGMLNPYDVRCFSDTSLISQYVADRLGRSAVRLEKGFMCYPDQNAGKTRTRLVIEGKIDGTTYYWPLTAGGEMGIERNMTYNYNILIRRKGTTDPDTPVEPKDIDIELNIKTWTEKENYQVRF